MTIGRRVYGLGAVVLGIQGLVFDRFGVMGLQVSPQVPSVHTLAYVAAAFVLLAGLATNVRRTAAIGALLLAAFFALALLVLRLPAALAQPMVWVSWENVAEGTVMALGGVLAWSLTAGVNEAGGAHTTRFVRPVFGLCLVVFGISEFVYAKFTASLVPVWLPPSQLAWAYVTGVAQIAAGLAILSGLRARLAAMLLTTMYLIFSLILHIPRVIAEPSNLGAWAENGTNLVLLGAAWCLADALGRAKARS
ncbi:MAG TPA: DoxX family membrane protein [Phenylobacterium sp.]